MNLSELLSLQLAALSSEAQIALMQENGFEMVEHPVVPEPVHSDHQVYVSHVKHKLRKDYDDVIQFEMNRELRYLLSQIDRAQLLSNTD